MKNLSAFNHPKDSSFVYFFKGDQYFKYDWANNEAVKNYPLPVSKWQGVPEDGIDAALNHPTERNRYIFFFKEGNCFLFDWQANKVIKKGLIGDFFKGLPVNKITAALNHPIYDDQIYFFEDHHYYKYDWTNQKIFSGYPLSNQKMWKGFPNNIVGAALNHPRQNNKVYLFLGSWYYRYDWQKDQIDPGYPLKTRVYWKGLTVEQLWKFQPVSLTILQSEEIWDDPYLGGLYWSTTIGTKDSTQVNVLDTFHLIGNNLDANKSITIPEQAKLAVKNDTNIWGYKAPYSEETPVSLMGYILIAMDKDFGGEDIVRQKLKDFAQQLKNALQKYIETVDWLDQPGNLPNVEALKAAFEKVKTELTTSVSFTAGGGQPSFSQWIGDDVIGLGDIRFINIDPSLLNLAPDLKNEVRSLHPGQMVIDVRKNKELLNIGAGHYQISIEVTRVDK